MDDPDAIALTDPAVAPEPQVLERVLGDSYAVYLQLLGWSAWGRT
jgi:hypothetical protein